MKKARLLITLMALLVAANTVAQDSYREAVKQYLNMNEQLEKSKSLVMPFRYMFDNNGPVDIDQLTQRYIDEQLEKDLVENTCTQFLTLGLTEGDIQEVVSLLSTPQGKTYHNHEVEWQADFLGGFFGSFFDLALMNDDDSNLEGENDDNSDLDDDFWKEGGLDKLMPPITPNPDIDAAYIDKFTKFVNKIGLVEQTINAFNEKTKDSSDGGQFMEWLEKSMFNNALNSAYDNLTLEDLDYADMLYSKESYRKLNDITNALDNDDFKPGKLMGQYLEWMKGQGAILTRDPQAAGEDFFKALMEGLESEE